MRVSSIAAKKMSCLWLSISDASPVATVGEGPLSGGFSEVIREQSMVRVATPGDTTGMGLDAG